ncbi:MAG: hypothetical protein COB98_05230 [Flavobacteriaceae bacterium]|nr:MAG: hypothetical protein COB98_05230 [Flavobacteriaceae bacterium]
MLDILFLSKLTKQGKIYYWVLQLTIDVLFIATLVLVYNYTFPTLMEEGRNIMIIGILSSAVVSGLICLAVWKKPKDQESLTNKL